MLRIWNKNLKKTRIDKVLACAILLLAFVTLSAFSVPNLSDNAHIVNTETKKLIAAKNGRYYQTKEQPQINVVTVNRLDNLTPKHLNKSKRQAFIVVGEKGTKKNVEIYSSKDLHDAFTADTRMNILRSASQDLKSNNNATFNRGLRYVFRACATKIDQQYNYALDKNDLTNQELNDLNHPNRIALPVAFAIVILAGALIWFLKYTQKKNNSQK